jgi:ABC-type Fe3+-hydroxamate transport system substrate-binding protein
MPAFFIFKFADSYFIINEMNYTDHTGNSFFLPNLPMRIVSLVPSQTELLADLGLSDRLVGITKYCIYPPELYLSVPHVGGTKSLNLKKIVALNPDFILANKEENKKEFIEHLRNRFPVWVSDVSNLYEAMDMIFNVGALTGASIQASKLIEDITIEFSKLKEGLAQYKPKRALYLIWRKPYMAVGGDTFISDMMLRAGLENVTYYHKRYPELTPAQIAELKPEVILLPSEPFPFKQHHQSEFKDICPEAKIILVDGEYFSWYGSRLKQAASYMLNLNRNLINT